MASHEAVQAGESKKILKPGNPSVATGARLLCDQYQMTERRAGHTGGQSRYEKERSTVTDMKYPMADLFTDAMVSLMYLNILTTWYLLLLTALWLFMQRLMKGLESERAS